MTKDDILKGLRDVWPGNSAELKYSFKLIDYLSALPDAQHKVNMGVLLAIADNYADNAALHVINYLCGSCNVLDLVFHISEAIMVHGVKRNVRKELTKQQMRAVRDFKINPVTGDVDTQIETKIMVSLRLTKDAAKALGYVSNPSRFFAAISSDPMTEDPRGPQHAF